MHIKNYFAALALLGFTFSGIAFASENQKIQRFEADLSNTQNIKVEIPSGQVVIVGTTGNTLVAEAKASCKEDKKTDTKACQVVLKEFEWSKKIGATAEIGLTPQKITRYEDIQLEVKISVPQDKNLNVSLSAGELRIEGTSGCVSASVNAGQLNLKLKESQLASADLHSTVGEAKLTNAKAETRSGERAFLVGADLHWDGAGKCRVKADVMAGEVHLTFY